MEIVNMNTLSPAQLDAAAELLSQALPRGWETPAEAMQEIRERLIPENTLLAAVENGEVLGWGGLLPGGYDGNVFELHPLAVRADKRRRGIGSAIVAAIEDAARAQGGLTIQLGADDDAPEGETSLAGVDLYDDLPGQLASFQAGTHQAGFYKKLGYQIIGVMPDANGIGRPDIFMAKALWKSR